MSKRLCCWIWIATMVGACGGGGGDDPGPLPDRPDAAPAGPLCEHETCGSPGDDPCCSGTTCADWDLLGPTECAGACDVGADCDTGCCVTLTNGEHTCAPEGFCDAGGSVPEYLCNELVECDQTNDYQGCVTSITNCVEGLSAAAQDSWIEAMYGCGAAADDNSCDSNYTYCWLNYVPSC